MNEVIRAAADLQDFCVESGWRYCFIGGLALQCYGEPRETVDVDVTLLTGFGNERPFVDALLKRYAARVDAPAEFAIRHRVLLLRARSGVGIDVALGGLPFEEEVFRRSGWFTYPGGFSLRVCTAEDLIVLKCFAARPKDWLDVEGILIRQSGKLDWTYIYAQLEPLAELKDSPEIMSEIAARRQKFDR